MQVKGCLLTAGVNNIFDTIGITEVEGVDGAFGADPW
jgi:hypothetical protein